MDGDGGEITDCCGSELLGSEGSNGMTEVIEGAGRGAEADVVGNGLEERRFRYGLNELDAMQSLGRIDIELSSVLCELGLSKTDIDLLELRKETELIVEHYATRNKKQKEHMKKNKEQMVKVRNEGEESTKKDGESSEEGLEELPRLTIGGSRTMLGQCNKFNGLAEDAEIKGDNKLPLGKVDGNIRELELLEEQRKKLGMEHGSVRKKLLKKTAQPAAVQNGPKRMDGERDAVQKDGEKRFRYDVKELKSLKSLAETDADLLKALHQLCLLKYQNDGNGSLIYPENKNRFKTTRRVIANRNLNNNSGNVASGPKMNGGDANLNRYRYSIDEMLSMKSGRNSVAGDIGSQGQLPDGFFRINRRCQNSIKSAIENPDVKIRSVADCLHDEYDTGDTLDKQEEGVVRGAEQKDHEEVEGGYSLQRKDESKRYMYSAKELLSLRPRTERAQNRRKIDPSKIRKRNTSKGGIQVGEEIDSVDELLTRFSPTLLQSSLPKDQQRNENQRPRIENRAKKQTTTDNSEMKQKVNTEGQIAENQCGRQEEEDEWDVYARWAYNEGYRGGYDEAYRLASTLRERLGM
eukprot:Plantae.Rhodophyta-Hildenbrandia_rubra.ctg13008.p1 GENE.Plantae.Rhodophyta-Hildenbrandia_rubra.ctg13008~~Plantae.Rhodophyta-Hildenbrandia_rubra.ctg13008.p1  ORF type:complete len:578 (+),score=112.14 Plantae.Rhodophyta-Hildenbrandia_rubra.ctg13008:2001-3734(+)